MTVKGPLFPNQDPPSNKRPSQVELQGSGRKLKTEGANSELLSHLRNTGTLEKPSWNFKFSMQDYDDLSKTDIPLHKIRIHGDNIPEEVLIKVIEKNKETLQEISLESCKYYSENFLSQLKGCEQLKVLLLPRCWHVNSSMVESIASISCLQKLSLEECAQVGDKDLQRIAVGNKELKELDLMLCTAITDEGLEALAKGAEKLEVLSLNRCLLITDRGLIALAENSIPLTSLDLSCCKEITDEGVRRIIQYKHLESLVLSWCVNLTDYTLESLAINLKESLKRLDVDRCKKITNTGIRCIAQYCQELKRLDITSCESLDETSIRDLAKGLPMIETLNIDKIHHKDLARLSEMFPQLKKLGIGGINSQTDEFSLRRLCQALKAFCAKTTSLQELHFGGGRIFYDELGEKFYEELRKRKIEIY